MVFIDDILVYSKTEGEHVRHLQVGLQTLSDHNLFANVEKSEFGQQKVRTWAYLVIFSWESKAQW